MNKHLIVLLTLFSIGCVKDPNDISTNTLFDVKVNSKHLNEAVFVADNNTRYTFQLTALNGVDIDNDKQVTVTVSDGTVSQVSNPTSGSSQSTLTVLGGKTTFYYVPGKKPQPSAILPISLNGLTQTFNISIRPSEPDILQLNISPANPSAGADIQAQAFLLKNNSSPGIVSEGLRIEFLVAKGDPSETVEPYAPVPNFTYSIYDDQSKMVSAIKSIQTNGGKGKVVITARYVKEDGTPVLQSRTVDYK